MFPDLKHYTVYVSIESGNADLDSVARNPKLQQAFKRLISHERDTINARSSNLEEHEITITQKAFAILMQHEDTLHGAIQLYVEEIIGLKFSTVQDESRVVQDAICVKATILARMLQLRLETSIR